MKKLPFHDLYESWGAQFIELNGWLIPYHFGDISDEVQAALNRVVLLDRSYLGKLKLTGDDALELLDRITSNDMKGLLASTYCDTIFNTPDGRLVDYCRVINLNPGLLIISSYMDSQHLLEWLERFIVTEDVQVEEAGDRFNWFTLLGPDSLALIHTLADEPVQTDDDVIWLTCAGESFPAIRNDHFLIPAYNLCFPTGDSSELIATLVDLLESHNGMMIGDGAFQIIRVESGMPDWGTEIKPDYNAHEARLLHAVSFTKDNYTGQEVIARLDTYDNVQKYLMIVDIDGKLDHQPPLQIFYDNEEIGTLTSYAFDPLNNRHVGLGYVKKAYTLEGLNLTVEVHSGPRRFAARLRVPPHERFD